MEPDLKRPKHQHQSPSTVPETQKYKPTINQMRFLHPYRYPGKPIVAMRSGSWRSVLQYYLTQDISSLSQTLQNNIYYRDDDCVVIYDGYPKARMHLLLLPRQLQSKEIQSIANLRKDDHYELLLKCHATARELVLHLTSEYKILYSKNGKKDNSKEDSQLPFPGFRIGYHAIPSMINLHLHILSMDLDSPCLKHKKHYNSFATTFFVDADRVEQELLANTVIAINLQAEEEKLSQSLKCFKCGQTQSNFPNLKNHLLQCRHPSEFAGADCTEELISSTLTMPD